MPLDPASSPGPEPRLGRSVSLDDAAQLLGVTRRTVYNRIRSGRLQTIRTLGGSQRVLLESITRTPVSFRGKSAHVAITNEFRITALTLNQRREFA